MALDPFTIGLALLGGGTYLQNQSQNRARRAHIDAINRENARQDAHRAEQRALLEDSTKKSSVESTMDNREILAKDLTEKFSRVAPTTTRIETDKNQGIKSFGEQLDRATEARAQDRGSSLARIAALSRAMQDAGIGRTLNARAIDRFSSHRRGSFNALTPELEAAAMRAHNPLAQLLQVFGQAAALYGLQAPAGSTGGGWRAGLGNFQPGQGAS